MVFGQQKSARLYAQAPCGKVNFQDAFSAATFLDKRLFRRAAVRLCITPTFAALSRALHIFRRVSLALASSPASVAFRRVRRRLATFSRTTRLCSVLRSPLRLRYLRLQANRSSGERSFTLLILILTFQLLIKMLQLQQVMLN